MIRSSRLAVLGSVLSSVMMGPVVLAGVGVLVTASAVPATTAPGGDGPDATNTLTRAQIADGWLLLFDGATTFGWKAEGEAAIEDAAKVEAGALVLGGAKAVVIRTTSEFPAFEFTFEYAGATRGSKLLIGSLGHELAPAASPADWMRGTARAESRDGQLRITAAVGPTGGKAADAGGTLSITKRGQARFTLGFSTPADGHLRLRNLKLKPLGLQSIFNGKDLTGWKIIPGRQSKFTVTEKGELNIKDGGGDIQTEGQWADFLLQLDVYSNGQNLNSGVFFRAKPGRFWSGYEAQIRNEWEGYSKNPKVAEKKEDRTRPIDIGTGGIYNRQATRKVVSNDKEWFTYTILAHGNHIATWVNGYQCADYYDNDKDAENARQGRYLGKGVISLQGHDPTTDLSFRNIKIADLGAKSAS